MSRNHDFADRGFAERIEESGGEVRGGLRAATSATFLTTSTKPHTFCGGEVKSQIKFFRLRKNFSALDRSQRRESDLLGVRGG